MDLNNFLDEIKKRRKVFIPELPKGTTIFIETQNSRYKFLLDEPNISYGRVWGGYYRKNNIEPCSTSINGSTLGNNIIVKDAIIEGMTLEFSDGIISSKVNNFFVIILN